jgi:hypothetical protein
VKLLGYLINALSISITKDRVIAFKNIEFLTILKVLETYISMTS